MNPDTTPLAKACMFCVGLVANSPEQHRLQYECRDILDRLTKLEQVLHGEDATGYPECEGF